MYSFGYYIQGFLLGVMGQGQYQHGNPAIDQNWVPVKRDSNTLFANVNPFAKRALYNKITNQQVQQYELQFLSEYDYKQYLTELRKRLQPTIQQRISHNNPENYFNLSPYIYTVWYFADNTVKDICSTIYKGLLYVPKVDLRLKQINDIPVSDQLYLTKATLSGFSVLYEKVGYFDISEEMIFVTKQGKVKVWVNSNLSKNEPLYIPSSAYRQLHGSQTQMVVQLLDIIDQNSDTQQSKDIHFKQYLIRKRLYNKLSFQRALEQFELYCMENNFFVDEAMKSIYELYHMEQPNRNSIDVSVHRYCEPLRNMPRTSCYQPKPERRSIYRTSVYDQQRRSHHESNAFLFGSKASKGSEYQPRFTHYPQHQEQFYRPRSNYCNFIQPVPERCINSPNEMFYQNNPNNQLRHASKSMTYFHTSTLPPLKKEVILPQVSFKRGNVQLPRRSQYLSTQHSFNFQAAKKKPTLIKFSYKPNQLCNSQSQLSVHRSTSNYISKLPPNLTTIQSMKVESAQSTKETSPFESQRTKQSSKNLKFFNSDETYTLDKQIAEDLQKFLGCIQKK